MSRDYTEFNNGLKKRIAIDSINDLPDDSFKTILQRALVEMWIVETFIEEKEMPELELIVQWNTIYINVDDDYNIQVEEAYNKDIWWCCVMFQVEDDDGNDWYNFVEDYRKADEDARVKMLMEKSEFILSLCIPNN